MHTQSMISSNLGKFQFQSLPFSSVYFAFQGKFMMKVEPQTKMCQKCYKFHTLTHFQINDCCHKQRRFVKTGNN
jgi:hypothetical protein